MIVPKVWNGHRMTSHTQRLDGPYEQAQALPPWPPAYVAHPVPARASFAQLANVLLMFSVFLAGYHLWRIPDANLTVSDLAFIAAFGLFMAQGRVNLVPFGPITPLWLVALALMLGGLFFSTMMNGDLTRWIIVAGQYLFSFFCIPIVLNALPQHRIKSLVVFLVLGVTAMELVGGIVILTLDYQSALHLLGEDFLGGNGRLGSFAGEPNWNGSLIAVASPMLVYCIKERLMPVVVGLVCGPILAWGLLLSASATGFAATVIAISILLLLLGASHLLRYVLIAALVGGLLVATGVPLPATFSKRVGTAISNGDISEAGTYTGRVRLIEEAWQMSEETALVGLGVDEFRNHNSMHQPVHNLYLLIWTEGGLVALLGLLTMLSLTIYMPISTLGTRRAESALAFSVVVVFLIYTMASPHIYARLSVMPLILALALLFSRKDVPS
ncbi:MAG: hypothetical protein JWO15_1268 [Sphingomonadales bacterium]|nr:hypothetical protein [Sphingomonadales bacterium]